MRSPLFLLPVLLLGCFSQEPVDFNVEIRPILNEKCISCHGGVRRRAELSLQFREDALVGGESGDPAVVPGDASASRMVQLVTHPDPSERMPKEGAPLSEDEIGRIKRWISEGAEWQKHWAYVPPQLPESPSVSNPDWIRSGLDAFVLARLDREGLSPSPQADCPVLARRMALDLIGLPADPDRVDVLCSDSTPSEEALGAYTDELLAHPGFGERWAGMWLDLARYADSKGYEADRHRTIWRYRDWVIQAFNDDMPFDQFSIEQLAGDLLPDPTTQQLIATAFHRNSMTNGEGGTDDEEHRVAAIVDRVGTTWEVWQGTTMACAQCHGHPYDPFRQEDFYRTMAVFNNTADWDQPSEEPVLFEYADAAEGRRVELALAQLEGELDRFLSSEASANNQNEWEANLGDPLVAGKLLTTVQNEVLRIAKTGAQERSPHQSAFIRDRFAEVHESADSFRGRKRKLAAERNALAETSTPIQKELGPDESRVTRVMLRGNFLTLGDEITPGTPSSLPSNLTRPDRLGLAEWLMSYENPLTARVTVNRFWEQLFGIGIVETLEDFGTVGEPPSHPELLDWLAVQFRTEMGWSVKTLLREIVLSSTYRQSSSRAAGDDDPFNRLLSRGPRVRLAGEQLRDQALAVGGILSHKQFGPSVMPPQPDGIWNNPYNDQQWVTSEGEDKNRRALYTYWRRTAPYPSLVTFDSPSREFCVSRRVRTNTPLQALVTLNDPVFWEAAGGLAARMTAAGANDRSRLAGGYRLAMARTPSSEKLDLLEGFLREARLVEPASLPADQPEPALVLAANIILNLDEFLTRE
ncbi:MAG: hypothetical protein ACI80V_000378 [Rhodothermales bacterium]|jgi:hypothetical protein